MRAAAPESRPAAERPLARPVGPSRGAGPSRHGRPSHGNGPSRHAGRWRGACPSRRANPSRLGASLAALTVALAPACVPDPGRADRGLSDYLRVLEAEDARPTDGPELALLHSSAEHPEPLVRRAAVRALGRLEEPAHRSAISARLDDPAPSVRMAAALALAQSANGRDGAAVLEPLLERAPLENDPAARGALARAIGRLRLTAAADRERALEAVLVLGRKLGSGPGGEAPLVTLEGVAMGLAAILGTGEAAGVSPEAATRLEELLAYGRDAPSGSASDSDAARVRALALSALGSARRLSAELVRFGLQDPDGEVRRSAVRQVGVVVPSRRRELVVRALDDPAHRVAIEAVRWLAGSTPTEEACTLLGRAARSGTATAPGPASSGAADTRTAPAPEEHPIGRGALPAPATRPGSPDDQPGGRAAVRMEALAALGESGCTGPAPAETLRDAAAEIGDEGGAWQVAAAALRSLARVDPEAGGRLLPRFAEHPDPFVRAHAARVAATLQDRRTLGPLSVDESANVRTAAIEALFELQGRGIDPLLRAHLVSDDPWLLLTAARLLSGTAAREETAEAALSAFERISEARRETWRDPRRALLALVREVGGPPAAAPTGATPAVAAPAGAPPAVATPGAEALAEPLAARLRPYLADYDPLVAADVAAILAAWTGERHEPAPRPLPGAPFPGPEELGRLARTTVTLHVRGLGPIVIRPLPHAAITNAARFVRLAERGYYDGLTFHRHAPNFVIQGGSPGANEYAGDGPYTRDEIEHAHWRGTVGLSTRGRDTGDGQIFINLVHNLRLDADYTVFGEVVEGMGVVDQVLEGAVIERAEVRVEADSAP